MVRRKGKREERRMEKGKRREGIETEDEDIERGKVR
jgi:hypothetical protein